MTFEEYLITKKIDSSLFKTSQESLWREWKALFTEVSPKSFTSQKLYLINPIRRQYPLSENVVDNTEDSSPKKMKVAPKIPKKNPS